MTYPKPLSKKSIDSLYQNAEISPEQRDFILKFVSACAELYGDVAAEDAWNVYMELSSKTETVRLHRRDFYAALGILRREKVPFYVFEADEVYSQEKREDKSRIIASKKLVRKGKRKFDLLYALDENTVGKPFYVPKNLLSYDPSAQDKYEKELIKVLEGLKCTAEEYTFGSQVLPCKYTGKYLKDFSYIDGADEFKLKCLSGEVEGYKANEKKAEELKKELYSINAAQRLVKELRFFSSVGMFSPSEELQDLFDALTELGVEPSVNKAKMIADAAVNMLNNQRLWCNCGWTPLELGRELDGGGKQAVTFGPGMKKAFERGDIDRDELVKLLKDMGIETAE